LLFKNLTAKILNSPRLTVGSIIEKAIKVATGRFKDLINGLMNRGGRPKIKDGGFKALPFELIDILWLPCRCKDSIPPSLKGEGAAATDARGASGDQN
jgi:hypothetical protein